MCDLCKAKPGLLKKTKTQRNYSDISMSERKRFRVPSSFKRNFRSNLWGLPVACTKRVQASRVRQRPLCVDLVTFAITEILDMLRYDGREQKTRFYSTKIKTNVEKCDFPRVYF